MTRRQNISTYISRLAVSLALLCLAHSASAQRLFKLQPDTIPMFRGLAVSFDVLGAGMLALSDYGQYEAALRVNLHDQWFPIVELGLGKAAHKDDEVTGLNYHTSAPYGRIGLDFNLLKDKHADNRLYGGFRYAYTSYKVDLDRQNFPDPVWQWDTGFGVVGESCSQHWVEAVFGVDVKIAGPAHLGWSVRYKRRVAHDDGIIGRTWYVPGFGIWGDTRLGGTFNVIIDI